MGIDDRDYMRERYRERQGKATGSTFWNDRKSRVEQPHDGNGKSVPLGSASWIGGSGGGGGGGWFDAASRRFQHRHDRHRPKRLVRVHPAQKWIMLLWAVPILFPAYREAKRSGWFPDRAAEMRFPSSGSVTVNNSVDPKTATSRLHITTNNANAVVQLYRWKTNEHVISVYVRGDDDVTTAIPPGKYRMLIVEGDKWHGLTDYFGSSTTTDTVVAAMQFKPRGGHSIDLNRRPDGNLHTRPKLTGPEALQ